MAACMPELSRDAHLHGSEERLLQAVCAACVGVFLVRPCGSTHHREASSTCLLAVSPTVALSVLSTVGLRHSKRCSRQLLNQRPRRNVSTSLASAHEPLGPAASATMSASATCSSLLRWRSSVHSSCLHGFANICIVYRHI
jgi:hypothetical protein